LQAKAALMNKHNKKRDGEIMDEDDNKDSAAQER
jgi:hypothetical protein